MATPTSPYGFTVGKTPVIEERVRYFTLTTLKPAKAPLTDGAADYVRGISTARYFLNLYGHADRAWHMKILSFDMLYTTVLQACDMAVSSLRAAASGDAGADIDVHKFVSAIKAKPVQDAMARIVRLLDTCVQPAVSLEFGNILTKSDVGTAVHHLMLRVDAIASHKINHETRLSSHQVYYVANELAAELCTRNVIYGAPFLVSAMRSALENHEARSPLESQLVRRFLKNPGLGEIDNKDMNAGSEAESPDALQPPTDESKTNSRQYVLAAADAWVRKDCRDRAVAHLVFAGYDRDVYYHRGPAYGGPPRLDSTRWAFWHDRLAMLKARVPAIYAASEEEAVAAVEEDDNDED